MHTFVSSLPGSSYSNDYGATWHIIDSGITDIHTELAFLNPLVGWKGQAFDTDPTGGMYKWKFHFSLDNNSLVANNYTNVSSVTKNNLSNPVIKLYPNPANDIVRIEGLNSSAKTTLSLFNVSGKLMQQSTVTGENYTYNLQKLTAGNYYITIESDKKTTTLKFVKE